MAKMIPSIIDSTTRSAGERDAFKRLRDDPTTNEWVVLHSLDIANPGHQLAAEIDFVIIVPKLGVLCVEVKATSHLRREEGIWYYGADPRGDSTGPFRQAASAMHSLRERVATRAPGLSGIVFWSAALFPLLRFDVQSDEWHGWQVIDRQGYMAGLATSCRRVLVAAREYLQRTPTARWFQPESSRPTGEEVGQLAGLLRPEFELFQSVRSRITQRDEELKRFTAEQFQALDAMENNPRVLFEGPAGTGKTMLAMEAARRASSPERRTALICFNRLLGAQLAGDMSPGSVEVSTLHKLMLDITGRPEDRQDFSRGDFWRIQLPKAAIDVLLDDYSNHMRYDELVVDEAQDVMQPLYLDFLDLFLEGGLRAGRWRFFGDFEAQSLYGSPAPVLDDLVQRRAPSTVRYGLRINCRNVPRIASLSCMLGGLDPPYSRVLRPDGGVEPQVVYYRDDLDQDRHLLTAIGELTEDGYRPRDIVILSPKSSGSCGKRLEAGRAMPLAGTAPSRRAGLTYATVHAFKGLEAPCIVLTDVESVAGERARSLFYTAATRAQDRLIVLARFDCRSEVIERLVSGAVEPSV